LQDTSDEDIYVQNKVSSKNKVIDDEDSIVNDVHSNEIGSNVPFISNKMHNKLITKKDKIALRKTQEERDEIKSPKEDVRKNKEMISDTDPDNIEIEEGQSLDFAALSDNEDVNYVVYDSLVAKAMNLEEETTSEIVNEGTNFDDSLHKRTTRMLCEKTDRKMTAKEKKLYEKNKQGLREGFTCETCFASYATKKLAKGCKCSVPKKKKGIKEYKFKCSVCYEKFENRGAAMRHCKTEKKKRKENKKKDNENKPPAYERTSRNLSKE
jgi:hypothetical protein